jgi:hypothetical protein
MFSSICLEQQEMVMLNELSYLPIFYILILKQNA